MKKQGAPIEESPQIQPSAGNGTEQYPLANSLDNEKMRLEIKKLQTELRTGSLTFEIIKAVGTFATVAGITLTLFLGFRTQRQAQLSRDDERFDKAVSRLGSPQVSERLTGVAGIQQFLRNAEAERQDSALSYLVNATVVEHDPVVRSALLDTFESISVLKISHSVLSDNLIAARDRNRAAWKRLRDAFWTDHMSSSTLPVDRDYDESLIGKPSQEEKESLEASAQIIAALVRAGAYSADLSGIYCLGCRFSSRSSPSHMEGVSFDNSFLRRANFAGAFLSSSSFHNASLILTRFLYTDLHGAKFTSDTGVAANVSASELAGDISYSFYGSNFACSNLSESDFTGTPLLGLIYNNPVSGGWVHHEFYGANLGGTKFDNSTVVIALPENLATKARGSSALMLPDQLTQSTLSAKYLIWEANWGNSTQGNKSIPREYWNDVRYALTSMNAAQNFRTSNLPRPLRQWANQNEALIAKPINGYDCKDPKYE